jgi:hypothetical protein
MFSNSQRSGTFAVFSRSSWYGDAEMRKFWRQMKHDLFDGRDPTLILAVIASFIAWNVTYLLRTIFG